MEESDCVFEKRKKALDLVTYEFRTPRKRRSARARALPDAGLPSCRPLAVWPFTFHQLKIIITITEREF